MTTQPESKCGDTIGEPQDYRKLLRRAEIPVRHSGDFKPARERVEWQEKHAMLTHRLHTGFLYALIGPRGTGKTQMASELIKACCWEQKTALYRQTMDFFMLIRSTYSDKGKDEAAALREYVSPRLLVLDEAHERGETAWEDRLLTNLIDKRYGAMKDTILISNKTQDEFLKSIGPSIASRMLETGGVIVCDWPSFRGM